MNEYGLELCEAVEEEGADQDFKKTNYLALQAPVAKGNANDAMKPYVTKLLPKYEKNPVIVNAIRTLLIVFGALFALSLVMWITRKRRFKKNDVYTSAAEATENAADEKASEV